ncbi:MAG: hypothetical protein ABIO39_01185 [Caulobacteraceae bacterium]
MVDDRGYAYVDHEREVNTYAELWHASDVVLTKGQADRQGSAWQYLSSLILSAFAFEAYMNHVGDAHFPNWDDLERLGPMEKLRHLSLAFKIDLGSNGERPLQTLRELIRLRNVLAHGRSVTLKPEPVLLPYDDPEFEAHIQAEPTTFWEQRIREPSFALKVREDLERALTVVHDALPEPKLPLFSFGFHTSGSRRA